MKEAYQFALKREFVLQEIPSLKKQISEKMKNRIEEIFAAGDKNLFDAEVVTLHSYQKDLLVVKKASYKECFASMHDKKVREALGLYPLAVCGRTICRGAVLLARRDRRLATNGGLLECVPSGGIEADSVGFDDPQKALLREFVEETQLPLVLINSIEPNCLVWTPDEGVFDICFDIKLHNDAILYPNKLNEECEEFLWWKPGDSTNEILPATKILLEHSF